MGVISCSWRLCLRKTYLRNSYAWMHLTMGLKRNNLQM